MTSSNPDHLPKTLFLKHRHTGGIRTSTDGSGWGDTNTQTVTDIKENMDKTESWTFVWTLEMVQLVLKHE